MQKLSAMDANFFYAESAKVPGHVASLQILDLPKHLTATEFVESLKVYLDHRKNLRSPRRHLRQRIP